MSEARMDAASSPGPGGWTAGPRFSVFFTILAFVAGVVMLTGAVITAANYLQARRNTEAAAHATLDVVAQRLENQVASFFGIADLLVDLYARNQRVNDGRHDIAPLIPAVFRALRLNPQIAGLYAGYGSGEFWEMFAFSERERPLLSRISAPLETRFALQAVLLDANGELIETWRFFGYDETEIGSRSGPAGDYDPRSRSWYMEAQRAPGHIVRTAPYVFNAASRTGLTIARAFEGGVVGTVAVDVTLDRLSTFLKSVQPNPRHRVLLLDDEGRLLAAPEDGDVAAARPVRVTDVNDKVVQAVAQKFLSAGPFDVEGIAVDGEPYLASVARISIEGHDNATLILNAAPRSDFEGSLAGAASRSVISALLVLLLASPAIVYFARIVSRPIVDLADNSRLIQAIMDTIPNPVFYLGPDTKYIGCNQAYESSFGTRRADIVGKRLLDRDHLPQEMRAGFQAENEEVIAKSDSRRHEIALVYADGKTREVLYHVTGFKKDDGSPGGLVGVLVDITEVKEAEHAMAHAKELAEAATKAKGEFLASMSHEIRTPLNGVAGMADLLAQTQLDADQRHMLNTIRESGNALMRVINDILDFSKIEAGKLAIENVPMSVADALEGVAITLTPAAAAKGIVIHTFVDPAIPATTEGDPVRLRQILFNLVGNAVKFSNGKDIRASARLLGLDNGGCRVRFDIIDHGIGISEENQAKLFQAFSQAESSTTRRFGGTGLGLAICKRLADLMGGVIGVTSRPAAGSTFFVELKFVVPEEPARVEIVRDLSGLRVLLLGSEDARRGAIEAYLSYWGALPTSATDEAEALEVIAAATPTIPFDSVIIDLDFDSERQVEVARKIRAVDRAPRIIILENFRDRGARIQNGETVVVDANPLVRHRIVSAVAVASGRASPEVKAQDDEAPMPSAAPPTVEEAAARGQLILLAEDNPTNQDVIRRQLQRLGYACEIVNNGAEALAAWTKKHYALILTDCHMPEMDGYQLTGAIRRQEAGTSRRTPVVAITANALQGEAERCLRAGMDDCLTKPVTMRGLGETVRKWMPGALPGALPAAESPGPDVTPRALSLPVDERVIKDMFGDDQAQFLEILDSFVQPSKAIVCAIVEGTRARDAERVKDAAHQLKSSSRTIGARNLADTSAALEAAAKAEEWSSIEALSKRTEEEMRGVVGYIDSALGGTET